MQKTTGTDVVWMVVEYHPGNQHPKWHWEKKAKTATSNTTSDMRYMRWCHCRSSKKRKTIFGTAEWATQYKMLTVIQLELKQHCLQNIHVYRFRYNLILYVSWNREDIPASSEIDSYSVCFFFLFHLKNKITYDQCRMFNDHFQQIWFVWGHRVRANKKIWRWLDGITMPTKISSWGHPTDGIKKFKRYKTENENETKNNNKKTIEKLGWYSVR